MLARMKDQFSPKIDNSDQTSVRFDGSAKHVLSSNNSSKIDKQAYLKL